MAQQLAQPHLVGASSTRAFKITGVPDSWMFAAGSLDAVDAPLNAVGNALYGFMPRNNVPALTSYGWFLIRAVGADLSFVTSSKCVLRILVQQDDGARAVPTLAATLRNLADPVVKHIPPPGLTLPTLQVATSRAGLALHGHGDPPKMGFWARAWEATKSTASMIGNFISSNAESLTKAGAAVASAYLKASAGGGAASRTVPLIEEAP